MITVLYIDDEPNNLAAFKRCFRKRFNVLTASSADEGKKILDVNIVHVVFCDQRMPAMSGIEFFESIIISHPKPVRVLVTGYADIDVVIDAINRGEVYKYISKPWNEADILNAIEKAYQVYVLNTVWLQQ